jgi:hypothetical protein
MKYRRRYGISFRVPRRISLRIWGVKRQAHPYGRFFKPQIMQHVTGIEHYNTVTTVSVHAPNTILYAGILMLSDFKGARETVCCYAVIC